MQNFIFYNDEQVEIFIGTHRFESGQKFGATVTLNYNLLGENWASRETEAMGEFGSETGIYFKTFTLNAIENGTYWGVIQSNIDLVNVNNIFHFRVMDRPNWLFGVF